MAFKLDDTPRTNAEQAPGINTIENILKKEIVFLGEKFNNHKKQAFYQELATLLKAGITLKESLGLILESLKKNSDKELIQKILHEIIKGMPFSEAIRVSKAFSEYEYYILRIGEETGTIPQVCYELKLYYEKKNEQKRIIIAALTYPVIVLSTAVIVVLFMLSYVVPMFQDIFTQNNMELPLLTKIIIKTSGFIKSYGMYAVILLALLIFAGNLFKNNYTYRRLLHYSVLKIPILGAFTNKIHLARFTQALALLTTAKIPMLNSIQMIKKMIRFVPFQDALNEVEKSLLKGNNLSSSLKSSPVFDNRIVSLVKVSEETNQSEYVFKQLNEQYNQEVVQQSKLLGNVIEPLIILLVGILVGVLLVAMYLPMFQLSSIIG